MLTSTLVSLAASCSLAYAQVQKGFNYGATNTDNSPKTLAQYQNEFTTAQNLVGTTGFASARLYTMIQAGTTNTPIEAIQAAINTKTSLLLGLWGSGGQSGIDNEIAALKSALSTYGPAFTNLIVGISVGSEDLYRISPTGIENLSGIGAGPDVISSYISQVKSAIAGTAAGSKPVGHVDTWTAWVNSSNDAVIAASDFIGMDAYPYFQTTMSNAIGSGYSLFFEAYDATVSAVRGKPVWVTETGWPVSGSTSNLAVPGLDNAKTYWDAVGCGRLFDKVNTYWYTLQDAAPTTPNPSFGVVGSTLSNTPLYDLSCSGVSRSSSAANPASVAAAVQSAKAGSVQDGGIAPNAKIGSGSAATAQASSPGATSAPAGTTASVGPTATPTASQATSKASSGGASSAVGPAPVVPSAASSTNPGTILSQTQPAGGAASAPTTLVTKTSVLSAASQAVATASGCPANLSGNFEYPHLIIPVNKAKPDTASGTSYNGTVSSTVSSIFNFDIPPSASGKTCSLVFLLPTQSKLTTSAFSLSGSGGLDVARLVGPATESTTYNNQPAVNATLSGPSSVTPGSEYVIGSGGCFAGSRTAYRLSSNGGLELNYFQNYSPSPIGLFITIC